MEPLILASQSPRRQQLMQSAGFTFETLVPNVDETIPAEMAAADAPVFLAQKKAQKVALERANATIVAADTIVVLGKDILGKPVHRAEAIAMLEALSGKVHEVITGVCILKDGIETTFSSTTEVHFNTLSSQQIQYYVDHYEPFDKAGGYAIQEWIGMVGIEKINGDYYNVMGLPISKVVAILNR